jgi:hypothetical protein
MYKYTWIDKIPSFEGVEQHFGRIFHYDAKVFHVEVDTTRLMKCQTAKEAYEYFTTFNSHRPVVEKWLDNFFRFEAKRWEAIRNLSPEPLKLWAPVACELELKAPEVEMHIDRIDRLTDGNLINLEYKTNKSWQVSDLRAELGFYNIYIGLAKHFEKPCTHYGCYNPQLNRHFAEPMTTRLRNRVLRIVAQFRLALKLNEFSPRPGFFCRYCSYVQRCLDNGVFTEVPSQADGQDNKTMEE